MKGKECLARLEDLNIGKKTEQRKDPRKKGTVIFDHHYRTLERLYPMKKEGTRHHNFLFTQIPPKLEIPTVHTEIEGRNKTILTKRDIKKPRERSSRGANSIQ